MIKAFNYKYGRVQLILTTIVWLLIFSSPVLFGDFSYGIKWEHIFRIWKEYMVLFMIFLMNRFVLLPYLFFKGKRIIYAVSIIAIIGLTSTFFYFDYIQKQESRFQRSEQRMFPPRFQQPDRQMMHPRPLPQDQPKEQIPPYANLLIMSILILGFDSGLIFSIKWVQSEQNKLRFEKESIENKMAFLQNQVSPHFFMNTLNNIHALVDISTDEAKEAIIRLSQMMGYMLYESQTEKITVQKEMDFIKSYVELMKLRFPEDVDIKLSIPNELPAVKIPPLLSISFIENAFKYGISYESPSFVHIDFRFSEKEMIFSIKNSMHKKSEKNKNSGIGIQNARNRLNLIYKEDYNLIINPLSENTFEVILSIPL